METAAELEKEQETRMNQMGPPEARWGWCVYMCVCMCAYLYLCVYVHVCMHAFILSLSVYAHILPENTLLFKIKLVSHV